jgi:OOP family OmpA-OmpF porin
VPKYAPVSAPAETPVTAFRADEVAMDRRYVLRRIQFEFNSYKLIGPSFDELDALALYLLKHPQVSIVVSGHTDDVGGDSYNQDLSQRRAETVAGYLKLQGVAGKRMSVEGHGKSMPLDTTGSETGREINRRVEIRFMN